MADHDSTSYGVIYCITNNVNGKKYIGQTTRTSEQRFIGHIYSKGKNGCRLLSAAISKYGRNAFSIETISVAYSQSQLDALEVAAIEQYGTTSRLVGYNIAPGGGGGKQSPETVELRVSKTRGLKRSSEFCEIVSRNTKGRKHSDETRAKIAAAARKRPPVSIETKRKLSEAAKRRIWTDDQRQKAAIVATGKRHSEETKRLLSAISSGKKQSLETIAKRVAATIGSVRSEETRRKISEARKTYWAAKKAGDKQI
jgi:group I intron endonuclease